MQGVVALTFGAALVALCAFPTVASAQIDERRKQAEELETQISANAEQLEALREQSKGLQLKVDDANATIAEAELRIAEARQETKRLVRLIRKRAAAIYRNSSEGTGVNVFDLDIRTLTSREAYTSAASDRDRLLIDQLDTARKALAASRKAAEDARKVAEDERARLAAQTADINAAQEERARLLDQVKGELEELVAQAAAARAAAEAPRAPTGETIDPATIPPVSGQAGAAIEFAKAQIGKPYQYAASGPDAYDCSGLTMAAWAAAGVSLPHYSGAQYSSLPHVPLDQLQPGDLIFWGPNASAHVALYVGGGNIIDTGSNSGSVKFRAIWGSPMGAARPG